MYQWIDDPTQPDYGQSTSRVCDKCGPVCLCQSERPPTCNPKWNNLYEVWCPCGWRETFRDHRIATQELDAHRTAGLHRGLGGALRDILNGLNRQCRA